MNVTMNPPGPTNQRILHEPGLKDPVLSKRVCFYKSGDPQFNGLKMVVNNRTFKTFDALLDSLSKKVPLPFGVRNITTPRGLHAICSLDDLEDGKSYICSDTRKVKPINLSKARKKLPPWYHARPASARRQTVQQTRQFPGRGVGKREVAVLRTPKKLVVFRNGEPTVRRTVVLRKRSSPTFNSILDYISELMQFQVVKLYTPDGRRVDGLPGLIMCSGTVVASGREPFKSANYSEEKSPAPTRVSNKRRSLKKLKSQNRGKKTLSHSSQSRIFSPSSESYIVNRIHNSIAESSLDRHLPTDPANSVDFESSRMLESLAGTEAETCVGDGAEGQDCTLPSEDDIEKSFRVNQDGTMTVEMRVRLTVKEEETVHWTTTLSRQTVANQGDVGCLPEPEAEQEICSHFPTPEPFDDDPHLDKANLDHDEDPPYLNNDTFYENFNEVEEVEGSVCPTLGYKQIKQQRASVETLKTMTPEGVQEGVLGSYSYEEHTENGDVTEQYCMVKQRTKRPVPKPRRLGSLDATNLQGSFKAAGMTQVLDSSGEEVTETVLHIYEHQTCHDNFLANVCASDRSTFRSDFGQTASSGTDGTTEHCGPPMSSTLKTDRPRSDTTVSPTARGVRTGSVPKSAKSKGRRTSLKPKQRSSTPVRRKKSNSPGRTRTKGKSFSSAKFIKRIYGNKSKSSKKTKKNLSRKGIVDVSVPRTRPTGGVKSLALDKPNTQSPVRDDTIKSQQRKTEPPSGRLGKNDDKTSGDLIQSSKPPDSPSVAHEYVQNWLEKNMTGRSSHPDVVPQTPEAPRPTGSSGFNAAAEEEKSATQPQRRLQSDGETSSVKLKIQSFETKLHSSNQSSIKNIENPSEKVLNDTDVEPFLQGNFKKLIVGIVTGPHEDQSNTGPCRMEGLVKTSSSMDRLSSMGRKLSNHQVTAANNHLVDTESQNESRPQPVKKVPLISNQSFERKMSLRKASLHRYTLGSDAESEETTSSVPNTGFTDHPHLLPSPKTAPSCCTPTSESSTTSGLSSISISSSEPSNLDHVPPTITDTDRKPPQTGASPKAPVRKEKVKSSPDPKRKPQSGDSHSDSTRSFRGHRLEEIASTNGIQQNTTPTQQRRKEKLSTKKTSPYSQSLDLASPPVRHRAVRRTLSRSLSSVVSSESEKKTRRKTPKRKHNQKPQTGGVNAVKQLHTQEVLEKIYDSIKQINQIPQTRSQSRPDYSTHVAATFGSPSKTLLTFLSIMSLKDHLTNFDAKQWDAAEVNCSEALQVIDSLKEIAGIEGSPKMKRSLSNLHQSVSEPLLRSWRDFQRICDQGDRRESFVNQVMADLGLPEKLKVELASLPGVNVRIRSNDINPSIQGTNHEEILSERSSVTRSPSVRTEEEPDLSRSNCNQVSRSSDLGSEKEMQHYVELNVTRKHSSLDLCGDPADPENPRTGPKSHKPIKGLGDGAHGGSGNWDEEQLDVEREEGEDGAEERFSSPEQDTEVKSEKLKALIEEMEEDEEQRDQELNRAETESLGVNISKGGSSSPETEKLNGHCGGHQEDLVFEVTICEDDIIKAKEDSVQGISQTVAERIILLEKHVAQSEKRKNLPETQRLSQRCITESDAENLSSQSPSSQSGLCTRSAPQSSLSFSYDSSGVITTEPEGRVRSIREMFLAKGTADVPHGSRGFSSGNSTDTVWSDGYQSQTSAKLSAGEDDPVRNFITKGFVRRTIERLYGRKDPDEVGERPTSAPKQKPSSSVFSSFKTARSRKMSELTYFYSANALDTLTEATRCMAFNAQVQPEDDTENGQWLLRDNTPIRKSFSDPAGIYTTFSNSPQVDGADEGERPETTENPTSKKCTYFSLPHTSDSDVGQDDLTVVGRTGQTVDGSTRDQQDSRVQEERNGMLPGGGLTDFRMKDNKVHPMVEVPPNGEVVVVQPGKGQGAVNRRLPEPDVLDFLYNFCGEHCPIL